MDQIVNASTCSELKELMDQDFDHLLQIFYETSMVSIDAIKAAAEQKNFEQLRQHAHSFKGSSANLGAERLAQLCKDMETAAAGRDAVKIEASLAVLEATYSAVVTALQGRA